MAPCRRGSPRKAATAAATSGACSTRCGCSARSASPASRSNPSTVVIVPFWVAGGISNSSSGTLAVAASDFTTCMAQSSDELSGTCCHLRIARHHLLRLAFALVFLQCPKFPPAALCVILHASLRLHKHSHHDQDACCCHSNSTFLRIHFIDVFGLACLLRASMSPAGKNREYRTPVSPYVPANCSSLFLDSPCSA